MILRRFPIRMTWRGVAVALVVGAWYAGPARAGEASLPEVDAVLARYFNAVGGRANWEKITSRVIEGEVEMSLLPGTSSLQMLAKAPDKQLSIITVPGLGEMREGYDGTTGWIKNPFQGLVERPASEMVKVRRDAQFNRELKLRQIYPDLAVKRVDRSGPEPLVVLEARPATNAVERFFFGERSGLLVRQESEFEGQNGPVRVRSEFEDYREVSGQVRIPHRLVVHFQGADGMGLELKVTVKEVRHNVPIEDAQFRKPEA